MPARGFATFLLVIVFLFSTMIANPAQADWQSGLAAFKAGDLDTAIREFKAIAEAQPDWYGGHLMLGQSLLRQKKAKAAVTHLRRAHELSPETSTSMALAQAAAYIKKWQLVDHALTGVDPATLDAKQQASFHRLRGLSSMDRKDWGTAVLELERATSLSPDDSRLRLQLAAAAKKSNRLDLAIAHYEAAHRLEPKNLDTLSDLTYARYAQAMALDDEAKSAACQKAAAPATELLGHAKTEIKTRLMIGLLQVCADDKDAAVATFSKTSERDPGEWEPLFYLARSHADWQEWEEAEKALLRLDSHRLEAKAERKVAHLRGRIYEGQHRFELAIEQYERVGDADKIARAERSLDIQRRNSELEEIQRQIDAIENASTELDKEEAELAGQGRWR